MSQPLVFDYILGKMRLSDALLASAATISIPDPLIVNGLSVKSLASINLLMVNNIYGSTATLGHLTTNTLNVYSTASIYLGHFVGLTASNISTNTIHTSNLFSSTATIGTAGLNTLQWNLTAGATVTQEGQMNWDANQQTAVVGMPGGNVDLALGMELLLPRRVRNSTGSTMPKGTAVYINGVSGNTPTVGRAIATSDTTSAFTIGLTAESIANNSTGWVTTFGELTGINLSSFTGGDTLYLSGATAGLYTNVPQLAPLHYVRVGTVVKATSDGALIVSILNGYETKEIHDIAISSLASGQILQSNGSLWFNVSPAFIPTASYPSLGSLAVRNNLNFYELVSYPSLGSLSIRNNLNFFELVSYPSLGSLSVRNNLNFYELVSYPSLGSLSQLNTLNINQLAGVSITSLASGQILISNATTFVNTTPIYVSFYGLLDEDPTSSSVKNGDNYWNNLDSRIQVYINRWREMNGGERLEMEDGNDLQLENKAYFQIEDIAPINSYVETNPFPSV